MIHILDIFKFLMRDSEHDVLHDSEIAKDVKY